MSTPNSKIPVTVLTGFLRSGKTTLLNRMNNGCIFKGVLHVAGPDRRVVVQGVHMLVDSVSEPWCDRERRTRLVFIGRDLPEEVLTAGFEQCLA